MTNKNPITRLDASLLAERFHAIMTVTKNRSDISLIGTNLTARKCLKEYLDICERTGIKGLHSESWVEYAEEVISEIEEEKAEAFKRVFGRRVSEK